MGEAPDWYTLIRAARYLGVAPWELLDQPIIWREWAEAATFAESEAKRQQQEREARRKG